MYEKQADRATLRLRILRVWRELRTLRHVVFSLQVPFLKDSRMAGTRFAYAPQRQILPLMRSRISSGESSIAPSVTALGQPASSSPSMPTAEQS